MIAARVEDFPDPVGPVTSTMPLRSVAISASVGGSFSSWSDGIFVGMTRSTAAKVPRCRKTLTRNRAPRQCDRQMRPGLLQRAQRMLVAADEIARNPRGIVGLRHRQRRDVDAGQLAMLFDLRRPRWRENEIADARRRFQHGGNQRRRFNRRRYRTRRAKECVGIGLRGRRGVRGHRVHVEIPWCIGRVPESRYPTAQAMNPTTIPKLTDMRGPSRRG